MCLKAEVQVYDNVEVSCFTGEIGSYENAFFTNVIRRKEIYIIRQVLQSEKPRLVLDYGCGGGWLSRLIYNWGLDVVGVDLSKKLVKVAKFVCHDGEFIVCDVMKLPFKDGIFDFVIGISILHHLPDLNSALNELARTSMPQAIFLFMEPNSLNPISALGRKFFPMEAHTKGEKTFTFGYLKAALSSAGFMVERYFAIFFLSFPVARFLKIARMRLPLWLVKMSSLFEEIAEKIPCIRCLNSTIVALVKRQ
ncbi:MAG: class I SAM-dependent methyltransferase [Candidatus Methanomethylicia archaeon]